MSLSDLERQRMYYAIDRGYRTRKRNWGGRKNLLIEGRASWSRTEVVAILGISTRTLGRYLAYGLIPRPTYPSPPNKHRFWNHQVLLLQELFNEMRKEGWPNAIPHIVGSPHWTRFLARLRSEWEKEPDDFRKWKARRGNDHPEGENKAGEYAGV